MTCHEDVLLMMYYHTGIYFSERKIWKIHKHSLEYKILEEELNNSSSEAATTKKLFLKNLQDSQENTYVEASFSKVADVHVCNVIKKRF